MNGHITLWSKFPKVSDVKVPKEPPDTNISVPLLAAYWANSASLFRRNVRPRHEGVLEVILHTIFLKRGFVQARMYSSVHKRIIGRVNRKIGELIGTRYRAKWAFVVNWYRLTYAGGWTGTKVQLLICLHIGHSIRYMPSKEVLGDSC